MKRFKTCLFPRVNDLKMDLKLGKIKHWEYTWKVSQSMKSRAMLKLREEWMREIDTDLWLPHS
jgi:hypothetical protein